MRLDNEPRTGDFAITTANASIVAIADWLQNAVVCYLAWEFCQEWIGSMAATLVDGSIVLPSPTSHS